MSIQGDSEGKVNLSTGHPAVFKYNIKMK